MGIVKVKRLFFLLAVLLPSIGWCDSVAFGGKGNGSVGFGGVGSGSVSFQVIPANSIPPIDIDFVSGGDTRTNVISSSESVTCTSNTTLLTTAFAFRRNLGQTVNSVSYAGRLMSLGGIAPSNISVDTAWYYLQNPPAGTANVVVTLSGSTPGFTQDSIGWKHATTAPDADGEFTSASIATSSSSVTPVSVKDIAVSVLCAQDTALAAPILTTSAATQRVSRTFSSAGNGGWFVIATSTVTVDPAVINWTMTAATKVSHSYFAVNP